MTSLPSWRGLWRARRAELATGAAVLVCFLVCFRRSIFGGEFLIVGDAFIYSYPLRAEAWAMLRSGRPPLWTPHILSGYPLLSMAQLGLAYPVTWGYALLPARWAEQLYVLAPYLLAPAFTFAYAREVGRSRLAALLAGLAFGYGGFMISWDGGNGLLNNAVMWLPLMLVALERARTRPFVPCLLGAAAAYTMSVLTGHGQSFLFVGLIAGAYAAFLSAACAPREAGGARSRRARWRPLAVAAGAALLAAGACAFQILESMRAHRRSIRGAISYETFGEGSFSWPLAAKSLVAPLYNYTSVTAYVAPLALVLAAWAVVAAARRRAPDARLWFWAALAALAVPLMLGPHTPLHRLLYRVPVLNLFRGSSRHAFEWTFALAVLAAYGWDACCAVRDRARSTRGVKWELLSVAALSSAALAWLLWARGAAEGAVSPELLTGLPESEYVAWKLLFTLLTLAAAWLAARACRPRWGALLAACAIVLACAAEPHILVSRWLYPWAKTAERLGADSAATRFLRAHAPDQNRVYTRVNPFLEPLTDAEPLDPPNLSAMHGLHEAGGYEPLILERYSRALGGVGADAASPRPGYGFDPTLFGDRSRVLDLLNARFVVSFPGLASMPYAPAVKDGITLARSEWAADIGPRERAAFAGGEEADTLALVTHLTGAAGVSAQTPVAVVRVSARGGRVIELQLKAGADTAEREHERADVRPVVRHGLATVFDSSPGDERGSYRTHRFWSRIELRERVVVEGVEIVSLTDEATLSVWHASLYDSPTGRSRTLTRLDARRWRVERDDEVLILRNERAQPRAWLVAEAESVDGEEALRRIRGEGGAADFDPRRTALVEALPDELPRLPGGEMSPTASARAAYGPNRIEIETDSPTPALLVVSETFYPGWEATVDGAAAKIFLTDFLLRGVAVPAGRHRVEMRYRAPAARNGALVSLATLALMCGLAYHARRAKTKKSKN